MPFMPSRRRQPPEKQLGAAGQPAAPCRLGGAQGGKRQKTGPNVESLARTNQQSPGHPILGLLELKEAGREEELKLQQRRAARRLATHGECKRLRSDFQSEQDVVGLSIHPAELGAQIACNFDRLFLDGKAPSTGEKLAAAIRYVVPAYNAKGTMALPRTARAPGGWRRLVPARLPLPWEFAAAMALHFLRINGLGVALSWPLTAGAYTRPGECLDLQVSQVRAQWGQSTRVFPWLSELLMQCAASRPASGKPWDFALKQPRANFLAAEGLVGINYLKPVLYMGRHFRHVETVHKFSFSDACQTCGWSEGGPDLSEFARAVRDNQGILYCSKGALVTLLQMLDGEGPAETGEDLAGRPGTADGVLGKDCARCAGAGCGLCAARLRVEDLVKAVFQRLDPHKKGRLGKEGLERFAGLLADRSKSVHERLFSQSEMLVTAKLTLSNAAETRILAGAIFTTVPTPVEAAVVASLLESGVGHNQQAQDWAKAKKEALSKGEGPPENTQGPPYLVLYATLVEQLVKVEESRLAATQTQLGEAHAKLKKYYDEVLCQEGGMLKASLDVRYLLCQRAKKIERKPEVAKITYLFQPTEIEVTVQSLFEAELAKAGGKPTLGSAPRGALERVGQALLDRLKKKKK
ncbi:unnamed protein product [Prorocentrum cordatum]|uniref:EF-hand domain-containing protein n=1 Tax=Prorocentrum cordatum TaxID=2364126 RepID=A0ABN9Q0J9_9DINO|nr:unnamed protein product [Polarella glacialis]